MDDDINRGDNLTKLGSLTFANFIPYGIEKLTAKELLVFRENSKDERQLFFDEMKKLSDTIMNVDDEKIINDIFNERMRELSACGVCCGVIGGIWDTKRKLRAETKKYSVNYLVQLSYHLSHNCNNRFFQDKGYTNLDYYHMYLNDRINEFIYD